jgi:hypothetical protein
MIITTAFLDTSFSAFCCGELLLAPKSEGCGEPWEEGVMEVWNPVPDLLPPLEPPAPPRGSVPDAKALPSS